MIDNPAQLYPIPIVRALIENSEGHVLLLKRADTAYGNGGWCLPGGKIDYGQTVEDALKREIKEETSLRLLSADFFFFQDSLPLQPGEMHCINLYFHCSVSGDLRLNDESSDYVWIGSSEIDSYNVVFRNEEAIKRHFESKG
jgi:8-oxo-dGTP diphosphatase